MNNEYQPINCGDYDFLEIACMDAYTVDIERSDDTVRGKAITTKKTEAGEFLILEQDNGKKLLIRADEIVKLVVLSDNPRFSEHTFK